jgi:hypothetical protein
LARGAEVRQFLNVELAVVEERVADLVVMLSDETILHLDFQSAIQVSYDLIDIRELDSASLLKAEIPATIPWRC